ncbi:MAG: RluA family pseudouridine synthase [Fusobacterium gastrosuis]|uniref:RluA family pseudouridine synthase n=1 Tax=Fusobacterium gastrosuis TaxID=1755100 RepID=UPI002A8A26D2|nr:RluA family pseudouridine synthase [Fusobacteriaceae bacterium]MDY4010873.1 RluA family pseudouridine synthase [Fusobacterium gastrosuis]MDY5794665.1 RluA family pseudouridine synthase [Fusobacterium gastrosuis]
MIEYIIDDEYSGVRIDRYLRKKLKNTNLSDIYKMIRKGKIKINEKKVKQDTRLNSGDILQLYSKINVDEEPQDKFIEISLERKKLLEDSIVFENADLFIINKSAGDIVHKGSGHSISLLEEYRAYFQNNTVNFVNRIDKDTSGLVIGAKNIRTARKIAEYIREREIEKKYYILVDGVIEQEEFFIENYLKKDEIEEKIIVSNEEKEGYKKSITFFKKIKVLQKNTILEADLKTGRTHQLRAQLAHIGHAIVGDKKYGKNNDKEKMYLFSHYINIPKENIEIDLEMPKNFLNIINN